MDQIKHEIGLKDDEVRIIVFTSMDMEYFNNLIILEAEFNKWFYLDFTEDDQEEIDFQENKIEMWEQTMC